MESTKTDSLDTFLALPSAKSPELHLTHPTARECLAIWKLTSTEWKDALSLSQYLEESAYLTTIPLARDGGMTLWVLVDKTLPPDQRPILCSCETFRKRSMVSDAKGILTETITHGVASLFCNPAYRRRGYGSRMMNELATVLRSWQVEHKKCVGIVLYSDIGKKFYANVGWHPSPTNIHIELAPLIASKPLRAKELLSSDLAQLCKEDETIMRKRMTNKSDGKIQMMIMPDHDHMLWHHKKEEFVCENLFGKQPRVKGVVTGQPGSRIWVIWTHRFYSDPRSASSGNTLYILRLVIENQAVASMLPSHGREVDFDIGHRDAQAEQMKMILESAQIEAAEWSLHDVKLWHPTPLIEALIECAGIQYCKVEREEEGIGCLLWYGEGNGRSDTMEWIGNEKYAWC